MLNEEERPVRQEVRLHLEMGEVLYGLGLAAVVEEELAIRMFKQPELLVDLLVLIRREEGVREVELAEVPELLEPTKVHLLLAQHAVMAVEAEGAIAEVLAVLAVMEVPREAVLGAVAVGLPQEELVV